MSKNYFKIDGISLLGHTSNPSDPTNGDIIYRSDLAKVQVYEGNNWGSLVGSTGIQGATGVAGVNGATGVAGVNGATGVAGISGATGVQGTTGVAGVNGATGIQGLTGAGIQGATGVAGVNGATGIQGIQGQTGIDGLIGVQGATGIQGTQGIQGQTGIQGTVGLQGSTGVQGIQGQTGIQGATGIQGVTGVGIQGSTGVAPSDPVSVAIVALDIDWSLGKAFYKTIAADSTFTFSNLIDGKTIAVLLINNTASAYTITFPSTKQETASLDVTLYANTSSIYTFFRCNGNTYCYSVSSIV